MAIPRFLALSGVHGMILPIRHISEQGEMKPRRTLPLLIILAVCSPATIAALRVGGATPFPNDSDGSVACKDECMTAVQHGVSAVNRQLAAEGTARMRLGKVVYATHQVVAGLKYKFIVSMTPRNANAPAQLFRFSVWARPWLHKYSVEGVHAMDRAAFRRFVARHQGHAGRRGSSDNAHLSDPCAGHAFSFCQMQINCNMHPGTQGMFFSAAACRCVDPHAPCPVRHNTAPRHNLRNAVSQSAQSGTSDVRAFSANANAAAAASVTRNGHVRDGADHASRTSDAGQGIFVYMVMAGVCFIFYWAYKQELSDQDSAGASRIIAAGNDFDDEDDDDHTSGV